MVAVMAGENRVGLDRSRSQDAERREVRIRRPRLSGGRSGIGDPRGLDGAPTVVMMNRDSKKNGSSQSRV
jgi:hypothetical protein